MATSKTASPRTNGARRPTPKPKRVLPPVTVAKLEETGRLLERVVATNQSLFVAKGQDYRETHRAGSSRPLSALESAQIAAVLADETSPVELTQDIQESTLRAYDEPDQREILFASGLGVASAFVEAVRLAVALVEMPAADFEEACEHDTLEQDLHMRAGELRKLELGEMKTRASEAFAHYAKAAGFEPGEAWRLPAQAVWQALAGAMSQLTDASASSQLTDSAASTPGPDEQSSTS